MADGAAAGGLLTLRASQRQQVAQVVALADRADVAGVLFLCPCGDAAGQPQPDFRVQLDDVRRGQVMRVRFRAVQDFDRPPRRDTHLHARAGCAPLQQKQRVAHGHRPHRAWQDRGDGQTMWCVVRQLPGRGTPLHQRVMPAFQVFFKNYCHVSHHGTGAGRSSIMQTMAYGVMRNIGACATL